VNIVTIEGRTLMAACVKNVCTKEFEEKEKEVIHLIKSFMPQTRIAKAAGVSATFVRNTAIRNNLQIVKVRKIEDRVKPEMVEAWKRARIAGITIAQLSRDSGFSPTIISRRTSGCVKPHIKTNRDRFLIVQEIESNARLHPIMYALGSSSGWVSRTDYDYGTKYMSRS